MHTIVELGNTNCAWCLNAMVEHLSARPLVRAVRSSMTAGCLEVDHDYKDDADLLMDIHDDLRGWVMAGNGEAVMVELDAHPDSRCPNSPTDRSASPGRSTAEVGKNPSAVSGWSEPVLGSFQSATRFDPHAAVVAPVTSDRDTTVFVVCLEPVQELPPHPAPAELTLLVIEGQPVITVGETSRPTTPGDVVVVATGTFHSLHAGTRRAVVVGVLNGSRE